MTYREFLLEIAKLGRVPHAELDVCSDEFRNILTVKSKVNKHTKPVQFKAKSMDNQIKNSDFIKSQEVATKVAKDINQFSFSQVSSKNNIVKNQCGDDYSSEDKSKKYTTAPPAPPVEPKTENPEKSTILGQLDKIIEEGEESRTESNCVAISGIDLFSLPASELGKDESEQDIQNEVENEQQLELENEVKSETKNKTKNDFLVKENGANVEVKNESKNDLIFDYTIHKEVSLNDKNEIIFKPVNVDLEIDNQFDLIKKQIKQLPKILEKYDKPFKSIKKQYRFFTEDEFALLNFSKKFNIVDFKNLYRNGFSVLNYYIDKMHMFSSKDLKEPALVDLNYYQKGKLQYKALMAFIISKSEFLDNYMYMIPKCVDNIYIKRVLALQDYNNVIKQLLIIYIQSRLILGSFSYKDAMDKLRLLDNDLRLLEQHKVSDVYIINNILFNMYYPKKLYSLKFNKVAFGNVIDNGMYFDGYAPFDFYKIITGSYYAYKHVLQKGLISFDNGLNNELIQEIKTELNRIDKKN